MELLVTTTLLMLAQSSPSICVHSQVYKEISGMRNRDTSDVPLLKTAALTTVECGIRCLQGSSCSFFLFNKSICSLFGSRPTASGNAVGAVYFAGVWDSGETSSHMCPVSSGYIFVENPRLCFKVNNNEAKWSDGQANCELEGGRLMVLSDNDIFDNITQWLIEANQSFYLWVGMTNTVGQRDWKWTDGSTNVKNWGAEGPPSNFGCGRIEVDKTTVEDTVMAGYSCDYPNSFICEIISF